MKALIHGGVGSGAIIVDQLIDYRSNVGSIVQGEE